MTAHPANAAKEFHVKRAKQAAKGDKQLLTSINRARRAYVVTHNQIRVKLHTDWAKQVIGAAIQREKNGTSYDPKSV